MRKYLVMFVALFVVVAVAMPVFALEVKYGGLFRARLQSNNNFDDGFDDHDDHQNYIDQRLRMFFIFQSSENLRLVTGFEQDVLWGDSRDPKLLTNHRDVVGLELKHAYVDFAIPNTPVRAMVGLQPLAFLSGWIVDEDFTAAVTKATFEPFRVTVGYVSERNSDVNEETDNIDDWVVALDYVSGPFKGSLVGFYQYGHDAGSWNGALFTRNSTIGYAPWGDNDNLFDLGLSFEYKDPLWSAFINFVKNLGSFDAANGDSIDYTGWMVEAGGAYYCGPWTFNLGGFVTSGDDDFTDDDVSNFVYPVGKSHYWAEIMGLGTLETTINGGAGAGAVDAPPSTRGAYDGADSPSNLWTITAGVAWQILDGTKATLNYYYIGTTEDVLSGFDRNLNPESSSSVGHELDLYLDQQIVDKLSLRLVGAYLFAEDGLTIFNEDDDLYEVGARLQWAF